MLGFYPTGSAPNGSFEAIGVVIEVPVDGIDAFKVPAARTVVFEGSKRVVTFEGSIRIVEFP